MDSRELYIDHWEKVHSTRTLDQQGWFQEVPQESLDFIAFASVEKSASIIDIGGGDSLLIDFLLERGYTDLTVLDISESALDKARKRLGEKASLVNWIVSDILDFHPDRQYDIWHDRAALHFLLSEDHIQSYAALVGRAIKNGGKMMLATFSTTGPIKCSGIPITQYTIHDLCDLVRPHFSCLKSFSPVHITPSGGKQNYSICWFEKARG